MYSSNPLVTVLMPVYNGEKYLDEAIKSVLNQTFTDFEFFIIDDCSTDESVKIIKSFDDGRIRLIQNKINLGQSVNMNRGIRFAKGIYIARMDQDDISRLDRLEEQIYFIKNKKCSIVGSWVYIIDGDSNLISYVQHPTEKNNIIDALGVNCALSHSSVMFNKIDIINLGGYSEDFIIAMDWDLWIRAIKNNLDIQNIPDYLVSIRKHGEQASISNNNLINLYKESIRLIYDSKSLILSKSNYKAALGWEYYFKICLSFYNKEIIQLIKNLFYVHGFIEFFKLFLFYKIIRNPQALFVTPMIKKNFKKEDIPLII